jgi:hypothetical protein
VDTAPKQIGGLNVVLCTPIDERHRYTHGSRHMIGGVPWGPAAGLAICQDEGSDSFYLFGCDEHWHNVTDTWHETIDEAMSQADFEYEGVASTWLRPS